MPLTAVTMRVFGPSSGCIRTDDTLSLPARIKTIVDGVAEVIATSTLKSTEGFTRLWPSVVVVIAYETAFILLSLCLKKIPVGIVYAVWSGVGVALVTLIAWFVLDQPLDGPALAGLALIVGGVMVINIFSRTVTE